MVGTQDAAVATAFVTSVMGWAKMKVGAGAPEFGRFGICSDPDAVHFGVYQK
jgi:predicted enzyme related to lactoylglutathione lyase